MEGDILSNGLRNRRFWRILLLEHSGLIMDGIQHWRLYVKVPMICLPFFTDQLVNARYITHVWKVGLRVENGWNREKMRSVIKELMEEKEGEQIRKRMSQLKEKAKLCLRPGGSSYESLERLANYISSS